MSHQSFTKWLQFREWANFGFDKDLGFKKKNQNTERPINPISGDEIVAELTRMPELRGKKVRRIFETTLLWGEHIGAIKVDLSPLGSYKALIKRQINDLEGNPVWICKGVIPFQETGCDFNEVHLAHKIYEYTEKIDNSSTEVASPDFPNFERLAFRMHDVNCRKYPDYCMFPVGFRKVFDNLYKTIYEFKGQGVEGPSSSRAEQFNIDTYWDKKKGLVRNWGYNIDSSTRQHTWSVQPSEWDEWFAPSQGIEEICKAVNNSFMTY